MQGAIVSVAQHEFNALVQDTKSAIDGLQRQRDSVVQAIEAAQQPNERPGPVLDEKVAQVMRLVDHLHRLNVVLDQVMCEVEEIETNHLKDPAVWAGILSDRARRQVAHPCRATTTVI
jgi:hypothetical protein